MCSELKAQQLPFYSQYRNNYFLFNPAIAGTKQTIDARLSYRMQWVNYDGAPSTLAASYNGRFAKNGAIGLGGFATQDIIGPNQQNTYNISAAYHIHFPDVELSLGMAGYLTQYSLNGNKMTIRDVQDPSVNQYRSTSAWAKNLGAGFYLYNDRFNFGLSALNYLQPEIGVFREDTAKKGIIKQITTSNMIVGYNWAATSNYLCENTFYFNYVAGAPIMIDYTFRFHYKQKGYIGGSIRLRDALVMHLGYNFTKFIQVSYSYDLLISSIRNYSGGSHEVMLVFSYGRDGNKKNRFLKQKYQYLL
jgi:type IX secretion system PorP/SprF family membrane protein